MGTRVWWTVPAVLFSKSGVCCLGSDAHMHSSLRSQELGHCYGVAFLSSFFLTVSGYLQVPQLSLFTLPARKLGSSFSTLSYTFYNCAHFWSQPTGGHREKETHGGLSHSHLWLEMKILLPQSSALSQWLSCKESTCDAGDTGDTGLIPR